MSRLMKIPNMRRYFTDPFGRKDRHYYESLSLEDKRKEYKCGERFVTLDQVLPWSEWRLSQKYRGDNLPSLAEINPTLNQIVSIWQGDITHLEIDAIVNAANRSLLGGGGVDGAIHSAAGWSLRDECEELNGCETGNTKLTSGHRLPAKYILHTVGPINASRDALKSCYETCLQLVEENNIRSVAFSCVATGVYGFPNEDAARVALETCRSWLETEDHHKEIERIIFCVFLDIDYKIYQRVMQQYFPRECDIPSEDAIQKRLDALRQTPLEDNSNSHTDEIDCSSGQLDGVTPPPDTLTNDEVNIEQSSSQLNDSSRDIPLDDSIHGQTPLEDNSNRNVKEIDSSKSLSQLPPPDCSTPPPDTITNDTQMSDDSSHPGDELIPPRDGLNDKTTGGDSSTLEDKQELKNSRQNNSCCQPLSGNDDQFFDTTQQDDSNIQTIPTLQKSVTAPPKLRNDDQQ